MKNLKKFFLVTVCALAVTASMSTAYASSVDTSKRSVTTSKSTSVYTKCKYDINDVTQAQKILVGYIEDTDNLAEFYDANNDGYFNINDVTTMQKMIAGII